LHLSADYIVACDHAPPKKGSIPQRQKVLPQVGSPLTPGVEIVLHNVDGTTECRYNQQTDPQQD
jgi:hypothetical protein